jgi:hypothetical protein
MAGKQAEPFKVAFVGIIREVKTRIDASGDKIGRIAIEFRPEGDTVADLDKLHKPDASVYVVVMEKGE